MKFNFATQYIAELENNINEDININAIIAFILTVCSKYNKAALIINPDIIQNVNIGFNEITNYYYGDLINWDSIFLLLRTGKETTKKGKGFWRICIHEKNGETKYFYPALGPDSKLQIQPKFVIDRLKKIIYEIYNLTQQKYSVRCLQ